MSPVSFRSVLRRWRRRDHHAEARYGDLPPATVDQSPGWISLLQPTSPLLPEVVSTLRGLLAAVPTRDLFSLDQEVRRRDGWQADGWRSLTAADVRSLAERTGDRATVSAAASMHRNGFVREAAVRVLDELDNPDVASWLVVTATDWVREVRTRATSAVLRRLL